MRQSSHSPREAIAESSADMMNTSIESATRSNAAPADSINFSASPDATRNHKPAFTLWSHWPAHGSSSSYMSISPRNSVVTIHLSWKLHLSRESPPREFPPSEFPPPEFPHHARHDTSSARYQLRPPFVTPRGLAASNQYPRSV